MRRDTIPPHFKHRKKKCTLNNFRVQINAYQYHADFIINCLDGPVDIENAIVDRLGKGDIKWEHLGEMMDPRVQRITYEEVINGGDNATSGDLYTQKKGLDLQWEQEHLKEGRYTLDMVKIDRKVREVISQIKIAEAEKANAQNRIDDAAPQVSVAT